MPDRRICRVQGREADYLLIHQRRKSTQIAPLSDPSLSELVPTRQIRHTHRRAPYEESSHPEYPQPGPACSLEPGHA